MSAAAERERWALALLSANAERSTNVLRRRFLLSPVPLAKAAAQCHMLTMVCSCDETRREGLRLVWFGLIESSGRAVESDSNELDELAALTLGAYQSARGGS